MNPAKQLDRAKTLFTQPLAKEGQCVEIVVEQIDRHRIDAAAGRSRHAAPARKGCTTQRSDRVML